MLTPRGQEQVRAASRLARFSGDIRWRGELRVSIHYVDGRAPRLICVKNDIVTDGLNLMRDALMGIVSSPEITYVGLGGDNSATTSGMHTLVDEQERFQVTSRTAGGTGAGTTGTYVPPQFANFQIEEIGWFGGAASATLNSGTLIARVLWSHLKDSGESLFITHLDTFS